MYDFEKHTGKSRKLSKNNKGKISLLSCNDSGWGLNSYHDNVQSARDYIEHHGYDKRKFRFKLAYPYFGMVGGAEISSTNLI